MTEQPPAARPANPGTATGSRRPGTRSRRVVSAPTGAAGDDVEERLPSWAEETPVAAGPPAVRVGPGGGSGGGSGDDRAWAAEAERLLADRPPHWS